MRTFAAAVIGLMLLGSSAHADEEDEGAKAYFEKDYGKALKILEPLADNGNWDAEALLGMMYSNGEGVAQNYTLSFKYYRDAARFGHPGAMHDLAVLYSNGQGVPQDYFHAYVWFSLSAATAASPDLRRYAVKARDEEAALLTPSQLLKAQELARRCQKSEFEDCD